MSVNASRKRRAKAWHRNQMSRYPLGISLNYLISMIEPAETPLMSLIKRQMAN